MAAMQNFLQSTGFYLFSQGENWKCLLMIFIACVLLYLGIKKKFGKNAVLKGTNYLDGATMRERNQQIGGHKAK